MASYVQSIYGSCIITPTNYAYDALNKVYENTPLKKTCEVSSRFFKALLKKPRDLAKGVEAFGRCFLLVLKKGGFAKKVDGVVTGAGQCKGWLTLIGLSDQIGNALNLRSSNVVSFKNGDKLILDEGTHVLREGDTLQLIGQAPSLAPNIEFQLQNGTLIRHENQMQNGDAHRSLPENRVELRQGNGKVFLLPNGARFQLGELHSPVEENESTSLKNIFAKTWFRKSLSAWAGVYSGVFESAKFLNITKVVSPGIFQIGSMAAIIAGSVARLGDDHKQYQTKGLGLENLVSVAGNISVFMLGAIPLANRKGLCGVSPKAMFFCSTISVLTNLSGHLLKSMNSPRYEDINTLLLA